MNQPTDLRELLREAREAAKDCSFIIAAWLSNPRERVDLEPAARVALKRWLELEPKLSDAALGHPPDAKQVAWRVRGYSSFKTAAGPWRYTDGPAEPAVNYRALCDVEPLYDAPQLPAGKGEVKIPLPKWHDLLLEIIQDWMTIPREIHERLVRDAKREALREAAAWFAEHYTPAHFKDVIAQKLRRMASEHERGG
jgi:hypothetical protein